MRNTLVDLNNYLFETLERITDDSLTEEQMQKEITRSQNVAKVAEAIIHNGELTLKTVEVLNEYGLKGYDQLPPMLGLSSGVPKDE